MRSLGQPAPSWAHINLSSSLDSLSIRGSSWSFSPKDSSATTRHNSVDYSVLQGNQLLGSIKAENFMELQASSSSLNVDFGTSVDMWCFTYTWLDQRKRATPTNTNKCATCQRARQLHHRGERRRWQPRVATSIWVDNRANNNHRASSLSLPSSSVNESDVSSGAADESRCRDRDYDTGTPAATAAEKGLAEVTTEAAPVRDASAIASKAAAATAATTTSTNPSYKAQATNLSHHPTKLSDQKKCNELEVSERLANNRCAPLVERASSFETESERRRRRRRRRSSTSDIKALGSAASDAIFGLSSRVVAKKQQAKIEVRVASNAEGVTPRGKGARVCEQPEHRRPQLADWAADESSDRVSVEPEEAAAMSDGHLATLLAPRSLPNNTVIADLRRCHRELAGPLCSRPAASGRLLARLAIGRRENSNKNSSASRLRFAMPEQLARLQVNLKPADYDSALSSLTSDVRYQLHLLLYGRAQVAWVLLTTAICISVPIALTHLAPPVIAGACGIWLALQLVGTWLALRLRQKLDQMLESSVAQANGFFMNHNLMLGVLNAASFWSGSNLMVPLLYFDTSTCREHIESIIRADCQAGHANDNQKTNRRQLDYPKLGIPLAESNVIAFAQSQLAKKIVLRYSQRWISYFDKRKLMFTDDHSEPRHLSTGKCLCQFIEEHFRNQVGAQRTTGNKKPVTTRNSYANMKATKLTINGTKQHNGTTGRPTPVPSLSKLLSQRDLTDNFMISMTESESRTKPEVEARVDSSITRNTFGSLNSTSADESSDSQASDSSRERKCHSTNTNHLSLEIDGDAIGRSDDLVKKLRLLLELNGDELQGLDKSIFSGLLYEAPNGYFPYLCDQNHPNNPGETSRQSSSQGNSRPQSGEGKRFFAQTESFFFLGANNKKNHRQEIKPTNHILKMC